MNDPRAPTDTPADGDGSLEEGGPVESCDVVVVGAGISGLCAARALAGAGRRIVVLDKGRGVGGRMATRRLGGAIADHGAQFFQARGPGFDGLVAAAHAAGAAAEWLAAAADGPSAVEAFGDDACDGLTVWRGAGGMTAPAKWLAAALAEAGVEIRTSSHAIGIGTAGDRVVVSLEHGPALAARAAVLSPPVPQTVALLAAGGLLERLLPGTRERLAAVSYEPCLALLLVLDRPSLVSPPGAVRFGGPGGADRGTTASMAGLASESRHPRERGAFPLAWIADNRLKGISEVPCLTLHATAAFSRERFDAPPDLVADALVEAARPWIDGDRAGPVAGIVERSVHRWRYARVARGCESPFLPVHGAPPVVLCGDAFGGPRVEGAADSGLAAGRWLADRLGPGRLG